MPDAVARDGDVGVRFVVAPLETALGEERHDVGAGRLDERPHDGAGARLDAAEAARSGAAEEPEQERFGLVVPRVADRDAVGREAPRRPLEKLVARARCAAASIDTSLVAASAATSADSTSIGRPIAAATPRQNRFVCLGRGATELMVEVREAGERIPAGALQLVQDVRQGHRVGPARDRHHDAAARAGSDRDAESSAGRGP